MTKHESEFNIEQYEEFYGDHQFSPLMPDDAIMAHRLFPRVAWALDLAKQYKPKKILDLGCLDGFTVLTLANNVSSITRGVGVDLSDMGTKLGRKHALNNNLPVVFETCAIEDFLEDTQEKFDFITLFEVIEHVKSPKTLLKLIDKVKTDDAKILITTPDFEGPIYGKDDEQNKCHIRLYNTTDDDYSATNKYGNIRKATSITKEIGKERIKEMEVISHLIHVLYE